MRGRVVGMPISALASMSTSVHRPCSCVGYLQCLPAGAMAAARKRATSIMMIAIIIVAIIIIAMIIVAIIVIAIIIIAIIIIASIMLVSLVPPRKGTTSALTRRASFIIFITFIQSLRDVIV